ncbi:MAG: PHP domain-containing protein [Candidatus Woesearchaeota archaeon]
MLKYDLHVHTKYSKCSGLKLSTLLKTAKKNGLNGIAITDHNTIRGALALKKLNKDRNFEVIIGEEIMTNNGELLAYYLKEEIRPGDVFEVIDKIKEQNGLISVAHPYSVYRQRIGSFIFKLKGKIDAVEVFNGRAILPYENRLAQNAAKLLNVGQTAGSDAHSRIEIGKAYTFFDEKYNLIEAVKKKKTNFKGVIWYAFPGGISSGIFKLKNFLRI